MTERPSDQPLRERALDVRGSFIVQAPAGSGKTGLLTQRFLALLAQVAAPEEIVAITFTRKAAAEMRERILGALKAAQAGEAGKDAHARRTLELARAALEQDVRQAWRLLHNPARLRILTFDSLCAALVRQMPILSRFGAAPAVVEDAGPLYREAASRILEQLESREAIGHAVARLLRHLDNQHERVQELIAAMLARRDQWLRHLAGSDDHRTRERLEAALARIVTEGLEAARAAFPEPRRDEFLRLLRFAAGQLGDEAELAVCRDLTDLPPARIEALPQWQAIVHWLLTKEGRLRKSPTKNQGFPPKSAAADSAEKRLFEAMKKGMSALLDSLREEAGFAQALARIPALPLPCYTDAQWQVLEALFALLVHAAAHLSVTFQQAGEVDFAEIAMQAVAALGEPEDPTDLALQLDYRIRHLLVDEFQDTSINQFELLKRLTAGWLPDDGRTLFLVGDPMQSIYRFREAEVGLFLEVKRHGLGCVRPTFLQLEVNFRSHAGLIDWVNAAFPRIFPAEDDEQAGAVAYTPSRSHHPVQPGEAVRIHPFARGEEAAEAETIVALVRQTLAGDAKAEVAILVRSRSHLLHIVPALREAGIRYQAVEIDSLASRPVVQDLLSLTRALLHPADRIAWLAVLRSPLCGLVQRDLLLLAGEPDDILPERLLRSGEQASLSVEGQRILQRVVPVLTQALAQRDRLPLRDWVEQTWLALGGPACLERPAAYEDAGTFLELLESLDAGGEVVDPARLAQAVEDLYARPDTGEAGRVQLMTIHRAKGLEFDTVIVPGLGKPPRSDERRLLYWQEQTFSGGETALLFGPIPGAGEEKNPTVEYLRNLEKTKGQYEAQRLLYVAVTRARRRLHLTGHANRNGNGEIRPTAGSLLELLWPVAGPAFVAHLEERAARPATGESDDQTLAILPPTALQRLPPEWQCPPPPAGLAVGPAAPMPEEATAIEFDWAGETARHVGTIVHRYLEFLGRLDPDRQQAFRPQQHQKRIQARLRQAGVIEEHLADATARVIAALDRVLADPRGRWILSSEHEAVRSEHPLTGILDGIPRRFIVDRSFIDEHGTRWIIDYKTSRHEGGGLDEFLDREVERYRAQLEGYARLFARREANPIRLGLYFPLLGGWREWAYGEPDR